MATYLITRKDTEALETIIFAAEGGEAVAVFTDPAPANKYIAAAGWEDEFVVATLQPIDFLEWLIRCYRKGVRYVVADPDRERQEAGQRLDTLDIEAQLKHAGQHIHFVANPDF